MKLITGWLVGAVLVVGQLPSTVLAQNLAPRMPYQEYAERIKSAGLTAPLTSDLFGESVSLYNGATQFSATDIDVPGNNTLPVRLGRRLKIDSRPEDAQILGGFGAWDINVPHISGTFLDNWMGNGKDGRRCSDFNIPLGWASFEAKDFYAGVQLNLPGREEEVLRTGGIAKIPLPADGLAYPLGTRTFDRIRCKASTQNGFPGEGFIVRDTSGLTYTLDVGFTRNAGVIEKPVYTAEPVPPSTVKANRTKVYLAVSRVEDRFGNWVNYRWEGDKLMEITSSDGRSISLGWSGAHVTSATANGRTWTYSYTLDEMRVTLPDLSSWLVKVTGALTPRYPWPNFETSGPSCGEPEEALGAQYVPPPQVTITHPSGAIGKFHFALQRHRRAGIPASACQPVWSWQGYTVYEMAIPNYFDVFSLGTKTISGPGLNDQHWTYEYEIVDYHLNQYGSTPCGQCQDVKSVRVREPGGVVKEHRFGVLWQWNDGRLLGVYTRAPDNTIVRSEVHTYLTDAQANGADFPDLYGAATSGDDGMTNRVRPIAVTTIALGGAIAGPDYYVPWQPPPPPPPCTVDCPPPPPPPDCDPTTHICQEPMGVESRESSVATSGTTVSSSAQGADVSTFTKQVNTFNVFANPLSVTKSSSLGPVKVDVTVYHDDMVKWVLGQVATFGTNGIEVSRIRYDANAMPWQTYSFGKLQNTLTYNVTPGPEAGTLHTVTDGRNHATTLTSWKRGIPQLIRHPATTEAPNGATESAVINDRGWIESVTDENGVGFTTTYGYDPMGRLASIVYPTGDSTAWATTTLRFEPVNAGEYGLPAGHWKHTVSTGAARKITYFDAMWRPVVEETYDAANSGGTLSQTVKRYNVDGRLVFQSYPMRGLTTYTAPTQGIHTDYDSLERVTSVRQDSELGMLETKTEYLPGLKTLVTNPRGKATLTAFHAYDQPAYDQPHGINHPEGASTEIYRNILGSPVTLLRRNADSSIAVARHYVYDAHQRLCKTIEPETAATVLDYDAAGNVAWSASGLSLLSTSGCETDAVPTGVRVTRTYDARNRLSTMLFPDGNGTQSWTYTPDGLPEAITTLNDQGTTSAVNGYTYNKRRLLTGESLRQPDLYTWALGYGYNGQGHVASHTSPGLAVDYAPNALGQPTQAGSYATGVSYFANGAMAQFTYGNGIVHTLVPNSRGLAERSRDAYGGTAVHDDSYDYDRNGNVAAISDGLPGGRGNRDMTYDDLDRLTITNSPMFGAANYGYDVLDNLKTVKVSGGTRPRDHTYVYDPSWRLTNVTNTVGGMSVVGLGYDVQGNLSNKNGQVYRFDFGNRLREATGKEQYRYDGHGRRIQAIHPTLGDIYSMYGSDGVLRYQQDYRTLKTSSYVHLNGSLVARVTDVTPGAPPPSLIAPANNSNGSYSVTWSTVANTSSYRIEESANGGAWTQVADTAGLTWNASGKANGGYRYRGRSCRMGCSAYSAIVTVTVNLMPTGVPVLSGPSYNTNGTYTLNWSGVSLATRYELDEQTNGGAWAQVQNTAALSMAIAGKTSGNYGYRVRACNTAGCAAWSATTTVAVQLPPSNPPTLSVPAQGLNGAYTVTWGSSPGATEYRLEESANAGAWTPTYTGTAQSQVFSGKEAGSNAYRIKACNPAGCSGVSASSSVQVIYPPATAPTASASAQAPNGAYTVSWTAVSTATSYQLEESANGGVWTLTHNVAATSAGFASKAGGSYSYRAKACNQAGCGPVSAAVGVQVFYAPTSPPTVTVPPQSFNGAYTVSWTGVGGATSYQLEESANGGVWTLLYNAAGTSTALSGRAAGSYSYRARACNTAGCSATSAAVAVQVTYAPSTAPLLSAPGQSYNGSYTASWTAVGTATSYQLEESANGGAWTLQYNAAGLSSALSGKAAGSYSYRVKACNVAGCGPISGTITTQVIYPPSSAPSVSAPAQNTNGSYTVSWTSVGTASSYQLDESINGGGWSLIHNDAGTSKAFAGKTAGSYSYRARACNAAGCGSTSSSVTVQVILPPTNAPVLSVPGSSASGSYSVSWTSLPVATSYQLQERPQGGLWVLIHDAAGTSTSLAGKGNGTYEYQVRGCNAAGCGPYSTVSGISVQMPPPPVPTGLYVQSNGWSCQISWNDSGASQYRLLDAYGSEYESSSTTFFWDAECAPSYQVAACNANGCSAWSAPAGAN